MLTIENVMEVQDASKCVYGGSLIDLSTYVIVCTLINAVFAYKLLFLVLVTHEQDHF